MVHTVLSHEDRHPVVSPPLPLPTPGSLSQADAKPREKAEREKRAPPSQLYGAEPFFRLTSLIIYAFISPKNSELLNPNVATSTACISHIEYQPWFWSILGGCAWVPECARGVIA